MQAERPSRLRWLPWPRGLPDFDLEESRNKKTSATHDAFLRRLADARRCAKEKSGNWPDCETIRIGKRSTLLCPASLREGNCTGDYQRSNTNSPPHFLAASCSAAWCLGLRRAEVLRLDPEDLDQKGGTNAVLGRCATPK